MKKILIAVLLSILNILVGCDKETDFGVEVDSVTFVETRDELRRFIGEDVNLPLITEWIDSGFFVIRLSTTFDALEYTRGKKAMIGVQGNFCDRSDYDVILTMPDLYFQGQSLRNIAMNSETPRLIRNERNLFVYDVIIFESWNKKREVSFEPQAENKKYYHRYSLKKNPEDVCIRIFGGNMLTHYHSTDVKVRAEVFRRMAPWIDPARKQKPNALPTSRNEFSRNL